MQLEVTGILAARVGYDYTAPLERYSDRTSTGWIVAVTGCALHNPLSRLQWPVYADSVIHRGIAHKKIIIFL
jgi:hypothetical protein